jgi:uncharacterized protein (DUF1697 family)
MPTKAPSKQIALLRGINVGGHNKVAMAALRELCEGLGLSCVQSILQSGNLVFQSDRLTDAALESLLETQTAKRLGVSADYIVRSGNELAQVIDRNPFPKEAKNDPSHLLVVFFKAAPRAKDVEALRDSIKGREVIAAAGKQLYVAYPDGIGRSKLTGTLIEKKLATKGTARNWNTLLKLCALCE